MPHASSLKHNPSYRETADVLKEHLRNLQKGRKQSPYPPTASEIRKEAEIILEAFLKQQISKGPHVEPCIDTEYQRVEEADVCISNGQQDLPEDIKCKYRQHTKSRSDETSTKAKKISIHSLLEADDSIPFADEDVGEDYEVSGKSRSLPSSINFSVHQNKIPARSARSLSPSSSIKIDAPGKHITPQKDVLLAPVDLSRSSRSKSTSPSKSDTVDLEVIQDKRRRHRSGSISSEDTDSPEIIHSDRKKKSLFRRAKERLNSFIQRERHLRENKSEKVKEKQKTKKKKSKSKNDKKNSLVLEERQTHKFGHIEQHRYKNGDKSGLFRSEETWESTDITDREKSRTKHIDKHSRVKESTDLSNSSSGIFSTLKRLSTRKGKKDRGKPQQHEDSDKISTSSRTIQGGNNSYDKTISLHEGDKQVKSREYGDSFKTEVDSHTHINTTRIVTAHGEDHIETGDTNYKPSQKGEGDSKRSDHQGGIVLKDKRLSDGSAGLNDISERQEDRIVRRDSGIDLPKTTTFAVEYECDETVRKIKHTDGIIDIDVDKHIHQRTFDDDLEIDGLDELDGQTGDSSQKKEKDEDREKIYGEIANRIAAIGDSYVRNSPQSHQPSTSEPHSPIASTSDQQLLGASSSSRDGEGLNSLEREIRDSLRQFGDNIKVEVTTATTEAAKEIAKQATYNMFKDTVNRTIGDEVGWNQLAMLFHLTKKGVQLAGVGGAVAVQVKENFLRYVEDKFAKWIVGQGGWDSVLTDTEASTDSEVD